MENKKLKIGIWKRQHEHKSVLVYTQNVTKILAEKNIDFYFIDINNKTIQENTTTLWDPTCVGGMYPNNILLDKNIPLVVTIHGVSNFVLPLKESANTIQEKIYILKQNFKRKLWWFLFQKKVKHIITVSDFSKNEINEILKIPTTKITSIYHGFDTTIFYKIKHPTNDFIFHISAFSIRKNIQRIINAYQLIDDINKPKLIIVSKNCPITINDTKITILKNGISFEELGKYMQNAKAFIFPSLHEGFGMPLAEAMACGVPIITSNSTACKEVVNDAAILVNPTSIEDIKNAIINIYINDALHQKLAQKSIERAKCFSWEKCTIQHIEIFSKFS